MMAAAELAEKKMPATTTIDSCDEKGQCVNAPIDGECEDGDACTEEDACVEGACVGVEVCDDENPCTTDSCDATGCVYENNEEHVRMVISAQMIPVMLSWVVRTSPTHWSATTTTVQSKTSAMREAVLVARPSDDGNVCTTASCDPLVEGGCVYENNTEPCDESLYC